MRPSKLTEEVRQEYESYLKDRFYEPELPTTTSLSGYLDVTRKTIHNWSKNDADFDKLLDHLKTHQERPLWNKGITHK